ncbi:DUF4383 domain-containing protein [Amycolatopsis acidiphila]|uniref:DUF4383 domain-containing protein n=1 Tax=Amycolatopsis acidiphila TaxID=715473 RepID=A0A557ZZQ2_9PSEU|nr:DUF4383 domain-containing protein [Amycolatopsis acidiphila]TVT17474.1 DUF4383 domain-containing protein [Amycolatopsis acidiphila]UIJ62188.1 DUF4383 domain-containing protein [Amycolatopsis acidiphila]GHG92458.1 hypothetical protein GCM10017788_69230 [Amycolatopsis acidiphila]
MASNPTRSRSRASVSRALALVIGVVYLVLGIAGFFLIDKPLWVFHTGPLLDVVRTAIGLLALVAARKGATAQVIGLVLFFGLAGFTVYGSLSAATMQPGDVRHFFDVHWGDNILHGITAVLGLVMGLLPQRAVHERPDPGHEE